MNATKPIIINGICLCSSTGIFNSWAKKVLKQLEQLHVYTNARVCVSGFSDF